MMKRQDISLIPDWRFSSLVEKTKGFFGQVSLEGKNRTGLSDLRWPDDFGGYKGTSPDPDERDPDVGGKPA